MRRFNWHVPNKIDKVRKKSHLTLLYLREDFQFECDKPQDNTTFTIDKREKQTP